jgi:hypothetical protein
LARVWSSRLTSSAGNEEVAGLRGLLRGGEMPAGEVAAADVDDLSVADQPLGGLPDLFPRSGPVDVVELVQVDVVGAQPAQAVLAGLADVQRGQAAGVRPSLSGM